MSDDNKGMEQQNTQDELDSLLDVLPLEITQVITEIDRNDELLEIIFDLGRVPTAR
jgi:stage III sporulation protein SpoIIIAA